MKKLNIALILSLFLACCNSQQEKNNMDPNQNAADSSHNYFSDTLNGKAVSLFTLKNSKGMVVQITNYGATIVSIRVPDKQGKFDDVVLGYDSIQGYVNGKAFFGCVVGRYANRIAKGKFSVDGREYNLAINNSPNSLHGGIKGFNKAVWDATEISNGVQLKYVSADGEEGYPGTLTTTVTYTLSDSNELKISYDATTDKPTVLNLSNHSYFNLAGQGKGDILGHEMILYADEFTPVDSTLIPTGKLAKVKGTALDFSSPHTIGERVDAKEEQMVFGKGYDHNYVIRGKDGEMKPAAKVTEPQSGRVMEVYTTQPGVQFYCGNFLNGGEKGKGSTFNYRNGFCLETQHFPDSPNQPSFPTTMLKPGEKFHAETIYKFSVKS